MYKRKEKYKTEKEKLETVKKNGYAINFINNPSEKVQLAAVKQRRRLLFNKK